MLMPTTFAPLSFISISKKYMGGGYNAARGLISRDMPDAHCLFSNRQSAGCDVFKTESGDETILIAGKDLIYKLYTRD